MGQGSKVRVPEKIGAERERGRKEKERGGVSLTGITSDFSFMCGTRPLNYRSPAALGQYVCCSLRYHTTLKSRVSVSLPWKRLGGRAGGSFSRKSLASVPESDKHERRVHRSSAGERRLTLPAELQETDPPPSIPASLRRKLDGGKTEESCRRNCIRAAVKEELKDGPTCIPTLQVPTSRPQKAVVLSMEELSKLISTSGAVQDR
ncbi:unnamed protein product [Miscanthus lutarioriparius]|uniref:Uncharacterized protein n=1 Tax=Miscanthus lutarioriparius TaxID=422564 RepID=A0A811PC61_9POAL|nr:unnamed protein product [Miscanthus lutarioriparius]